MENVLRLHSPIPPSVNHYLAHRAVMQNGKPMAMVYETKEAKDYKKKFKAYIAEEVKKQGWTFNEDKYQHYYVDCIFYFPRIDLDPNNNFKCSLDAITETGMVWVDDNTVCERVQRIYYDSENPGIDMTIYPVEYIGIFDNQDELDSFESRCKNCKRYARNCSLLKNAKIGRIQSEIHECDGCLICEKENRING